MSLEYPNPNLRNINSTDAKGKVLARIEDLKPIIDKVNELDENSFTLPYKVYTAVIAQSGTNIPTATVLENTIGTVTFTRPGQGSYRITSSGLFTLGKTTITLSIGRIAKFVRTDLATANFCVFQTADISDVLQDDLLDDCILEVRVYN